MPADSPWSRVIMTSQVSSFAVFYDRNDFLQATPPPWCMDILCHTFRRQKETVAPMTIPTKTHQTRKTSENMK